MLRSTSVKQTEHPLHAARTQKVKKPHTFNPINSDALTGCHRGNFVSADCRGSPTGLSTKLVWVLVQAIKSAVVATHLLANKGIAVNICK